MDTPLCKEGINPEAWNHLHPRVREIFNFCEIAFSKRGLTCLITSMIRPKLDDTGIHATGRALDFVLRTGTGKGNQLNVYANDCVYFAQCFSKLFIRYKIGPTIIYHNVGLGYHFHIQVDPTEGWVDLNGEIPGVGHPTEPKIDL